MATNNAINTDTNSFCKTANNLSDVTTKATAALNLFTTTAVNTTAVLAASAYGTEVICTGASAYSVTLPTVTANANKFIDIFSQTTSNALVTITPASGTIAGQATLVIGTGDGVRIMNDGTNWWVLNTWLQPVNFVATLSANQSINDATTTLVAFDGTSFNIGSFFNTSTHIFTPLLPGKFQFSHSGAFVTAAGSVQYINFIQKNGSNVMRSLGVFPGPNEVVSLVCEYFTVMNGTTDAVSAYARQVSGGALDYGSTASAFTQFSGYRISLF